MSLGDLNPTHHGASRSGGFRLNLTAREEQILRKEVDNLAVKSIREIMVQRQQKKQEANQILESYRKMAPSFLPKSQRKSKSASKDNIPPLPPVKRPWTPTQRLPAVDVPNYNPLDKHIRRPPPERTKKYPYSKDDTVTTKEMKKPRVTATGIYPIRDSMDVSDVNVLMQGRGAAGKNETVDEDMVKEEITMIQDAEVEKVEEAAPQKMPMIVGSLGTVTKVSMTTRGEKGTLARSHAGKRVKSAASSLRSGDLEPPGDKVLVIPDAEHESVASSENSIKSTQELLDEARAISIAPERHTGKTKENRARRSSRSTPGAPGRRSSVRPGDQETPESRNTVRSVDEIIASLRDPSNEGAQSDSDKKIEELMGQIFSRSGSSMANSAPDESGLPLEDNEETDRGLQDEDGALDDKTDHTESKDVSARQDTEDGTSIGPKTEAAEATLAELTKGMRLELEAREDEDKSEDDDESEDESFGFGMMDDDDGLTVDEAKKILAQPDDVTWEDVVGIQGQGIPTGKPSVESEKAEVPDEVSGEAREEVEKSIHFFCTYHPSAVLVHPRLREEWIKQHVPARRPQRAPSPVAMSRVESAATERSCSPSAPSSTTSRPRLPSPTASETRVNFAADRILGHAEEQLEEWQELARQAIELITGPMAIRGEAMELQETWGAPWELAPPKMQATPYQVRRVLFPQYAGIFADDAPSSSHYDSDDSGSEEEDEVGGGLAVDPEYVRVREGILSRRHVSTEDLSALMLVRRRPQSPSTALLESEFSVEPSPRKLSATTGRTLQSPTPRLTFDEMRRRMAEAREAPPPVEASEPVGSVHNELLLPPPPPRRWTSVPNIHVGADEALIMHFDYDEVMDELRGQAALMQEHREALLIASEVPPTAEMEETDEGEEEEKEEEEVPERNPTTVSHKRRKPLSKTEPRPTPAELALKAGRNYVIIPKKRNVEKKIRRPRHVSMERIDAIERFLNSTPTRLDRRHSLSCLRKPIDYELRVPRTVRLGRRNSTPNIFDFDSWAWNNGFRQEQDPRDWVTVIWDAWFDEVYPPVEAEPLYTAVHVPEPHHVSLEVPEGPSRPEDSRPTDDTRRQQSSGTSIPTSEPVYELPFQIQMILDEVDEDSREEVSELLEEEVRKLTSQVVASKTPNAFLLCRRGALLRKLGRLANSLDDLNTAIDLEPLMLDAYWHRHLLYLLQNRLYDCLDDLNFLLKHQRSHIGAYKSRAEVYRRLGDVTMAIINYSQAIKLDPKNAEAYFKRAEMYEKRGEMRLALEDYQTTTKLQPNKTEAIFKHGYYYFNNEQWQFAIADFSELLRQDPTDSRARTYRGRALVKLGLWAPALQDLSAAVHLDPENHLAFYYRGCLLRKAQPEKSLQDLSVSLLIDDSEENVMAYLHRGILYCELGRPEDAIADFEAVIALNTEIPCAHVNLGLIYFNMHHYLKAIQSFTAAVKVDPTYVRAFVCRAEAYSHMHDYKNALLDITRAIHLQPTNPHYYMFRGQLVLKTGNLDLAAFCVRHAAEMNEDLGTSATQQALVQSFLGNFDRAILALMTAVKSKPTQALFSLLGRTQMKAGQWEAAVVSFIKCLDLLRESMRTKAPKEPRRQEPWSKFQAWPLAAADINFLIGQCHMEMKNFPKAHEAFNAAIHINPKYSEAYYQRGLCKMRLKTSKAIQDFNRGLAIDPSRYEIYLSRAAYYGIKGRYSKGILNCNEAIKLQPKSVRAYLYRGALKYHIRAFGLAVDDLSVASRIDSNCSLAFFNRALCHHENKTYSKALQDYGIVLLLDDPLLTYKVLINRGLLYLELGDAKNALMDFLLALEAQPKDHRLLHTIGLCYHKLGQLVSAVKSFSRALDLSPVFLESYIGRGNAYMDFGHEQGLMMARRDYQRILMHSPTNLSARINLAINLQVSGRFWQAWRQFSVVLNHHPRSVRALEGRAIVCLQMSNATAALQDLDRAVGIRASAEVLTSRGVVHQFLSDRVNAMRDFRRATVVNPKMALAYYNMGNIYLHQRQYLQAIDFYSRAISLNSKDEGAYINRALVRILKKDYTGAQEDFRYAIKLSPYSAHIYFNRGNLFMKMEELEKAEKDFNKALTLQPDDATALKCRADVRGKMGKRDAALDDYKRAIYISSKLSGD